MSGERKVWCRQITNVWRTTRCDTHTELISDTSILCLVQRNCICPVNSYILRLTFCKFLCTTDLRPDTKNYSIWWADMYFFTSLYCSGLCSCFVITSDDESLWSKGPVSVNVQNKPFWVAFLSQKGSEQRQEYYLSCFSLDLIMWNVWQKIIVI